MRKCGGDKTFYNVTGLVFPPHVTSRDRPDQGQAGKPAIKGGTVTPAPGHGVQKNFRTRFRHRSRIHHRWTERCTTRIQNWRMVSLTQNQARIVLPYNTPHAIFTANSYVQDGDIQKEAKRFHLRQAWLEQAATRFEEVFNLYCEVCESQPGVPLSRKDEEEFLSLERWADFHLDNNEGSSQMDETIQKTGPTTPPRGERRVEPPVCSLSRRDRVRPAERFLAPPLARQYQRVTGLNHVLGHQQRPDCFSPTPRRSVP